jgi:hypothetical protein
MEIARDNANNVTNIFSRCLLSCPHIDLWTTYLKFIKKVADRRRCIWVLS